MKDLYYMLRYCLRIGHRYAAGVETKDGTRVATCVVCGYKKEALPMRDCKHPQTSVRVYKKVDGDLEYNKIEVVCIRCLRTVDIDIANKEHI